MIELFCVADISVCNNLLCYCEGNGSCQASGNSHGWGRVQPQVPAAKQIAFFEEQPDSWETDFCYPIKRGHCLPKTRLCHMFGETEEWVFHGQLPSSVLFLLSCEVVQGKAHSMAVFGVRLTPWQCSWWGLQHGSVQGKAFSMLVFMVRLMSCQT